MISARWRLTASPWPLLLLALPAIASVDGVVMNVTTGKPQASVIVSLVQPGSGGMTNLGSTRSDAQGKFRFDKEIPPGPALLQGVHQGATYNLMLPPGGPTSGVQLKVWDSKVNPEIGRLAKHLIVIEPAPEGIRISDDFIFENETNTTFQNPAGSVQFYLPKEATSPPQVTVKGVDGMPIRREAEKTSTPGLYKVSYPIRPGSTEINVNYALPPSSTLSGKFVAEAARPFLVTPASVTLTGEGVSLTPKQPLPNAHVYLVDGLSFTVAIAGTGAMREQAAEGQPQQDDESGGAPVLQHEARVYTKLPYVLGLVFAILLLGGILLYRKGAA